MRRNKTLPKKVDRFLDYMIKPTIVWAIMFLRIYINRNPKTLSFQNQLFVEASVKSCEHHKTSGFKKWVWVQGWTIIMWILSCDNAYNTRFHTLLREYDKLKLEAKIK